MVRHAGVYLSTPDWSSVHHRKHTHTHTREKFRASHQPNVLLDCGRKLDQTHKQEKSMQTHRSIVNTARTETSTVEQRTKKNTSMFYMDLFDLNPKCYREILTEAPSSGVSRCTVLHVTTQNQAVSWVMEAPLIP